MEKNLDEKLYNDYLNGEKEAFEILYNKYKNKIQYSPSWRTASKRRKSQKWRFAATVTTAK